ncbi:Down syndrome cell adhesion molecule-like protein Dscam2 isoform X3 [Limulus polyphemus]|uniref:Down syndrome cell adhesion molecule-like protein Dscam2 isoform X3 n=1 Tax=Limulus polyphemus TaxID=6850 RepID=A0ABM1TBA3_LIMPO|nr:Down syndrome cell adhesion molecule-like protein Dscam2 isoform X3 [Limulus polyphemus]
MRIEVITVLSSLILCSLGRVSRKADDLFPVFTTEPPSYVPFLNSSGMVISCSLTGRPATVVTWRKADGSPLTNIPRLRYIRSDGALLFPPFHPGDYRPEIHNAIYRCVSSSTVGCLGSRDVRVRGVVPVSYVVGVSDSIVTRTNTAVVRCQVPTGVSHYVVVSAWESNNGHSVLPDADPNFSGDKYLGFSTGELHIHNVRNTDDKQRFRCQVTNILTGERTFSSSWAKLVVTEPRNKFAPRIQEEANIVEVREKRIAKLPCVAHGHPRPEYQWYRLESLKLRAVDLGSRVNLLHGTLILRDTRISDSGDYVCVAKNSLAKLTVTIRPRSPRLQVVKYGEKIGLNCTVNGNPVETTYWIKDQTVNIKQTPDRRLEISSFEKEDSGVYQCYAQNDVDSAQDHVILKLEEKPPRLTKVFHKQLLMPGAEVSLKCVAIGSPLPQVFWTLDGAALPSNRRLQTGDFVDVNGTLISFVNVSDLRLEDGGNYQCLANNQIATATHEARIDVIGRPFIRPMENLTVVTGRSLEVRCPVSGHPIEEVYFRKDGRTIPTTHRVKTQDWMLIIREIRAEDGGLYSCIAENGQGENAIKYFELKVLAAPVVSPFSFPKNLEEGMRATALCTVLAGDSPVRLAWYKDDQRIQDISGNMRIVSISEFILSLIIDTVDRHHNGNYTCEARNKAASVNISAAMFVRASPRWRIKPTETRVVLSQLVRLDCQADGQPNPVIRWKYSRKRGSSHYKNIISGPHKHVLENGSLTITGVLSSDSGYYMCEADNNVGHSLTETVPLIVQVPPQIHTNDEVAEVKKSEEVVLTCSIYGDDPLAVFWTKNRNTIYTYNTLRYKITEQELGSKKIATLRINPAAREDSGEFGCTASNPYGKHSKIFNVIVKEPPDPPGRIKVDRVTGTTVLLSWVAPYAGNSPVTSYTIIYWIDKEQNATKWELTVSDPKTTATITDLRPKTTYRFKVVAENSIGVSDQQEELKFITGIEAPRNAPRDVTVIALDISSVQLSWSFPQGDESVDTINGFYIGHREYRKRGSFLNQTMLVNTTNNRWEFVVRELKRATLYSFVVQAFNDQGPGPQSVETFVRTLEFDPPNTPRIKVSSSTSTSLQLMWELETDNNTPVRSFILNYKEDANSWQDVNLPSKPYSYILNNLRCGATYQLYLTAFNDMGRSDPSEVVKVALEGTKPTAPQVEKFVATNSSTAKFNLLTWTDGGCPLRYFIIHYKPQSQKEWTLLSNHVTPDQKNVVVTDLRPGTWYDLLVIAQNDAGTTEAQYRFATLTVTGATISPYAAVDIEQSSFIKDPAVVVPTVCAIFVILVIILMSALVIIWRRREREPDAVSRNYGSREDNISMNSYGKIKSTTSTDAQREPVYYPSHYATTHTPAENADRVNHATIRRVRSRPSDYTYDIPLRQQHVEDSMHQYSVLWTNSHAGREQMYEKHIRAALPPNVPDDVEEIRSKDITKSGIHVSLDKKPTSMETSEEFSETECDRDRYIASADTLHLSATY